MEFHTELGTPVCARREDDQLWLGVSSCMSRINSMDAHKLADWIKENIPEPPPAPPEWRIVIGEERVALMIGLVSMGVIGSDGIVRDYGVSEYDGVTPELHKEMICALLDAHYEMHKGDS